MDRDISVKPTRAKTTDNKIRVVSTYGTSSELVTVFKQAEKDLKNTNSFKTHTDSIFKVVNRTAPSIRNKLSALKYHALGSRFGQTKSCK